jgi:hypothetical protein
MMGVVRHGVTLYVIPDAERSAADKD